MFSYALFRKTLADTAWSLTLSAIGLTGFVVLFSWAMLNMGLETLEFFSRFPFLKKIFASFGIDVSGEVSLETMFAVSFTHGVAFGLVWTVVIATATRVTAGEVERGTADILLSLPINRLEACISTSLVWIFSALVLSCCPLLGFWISSLVYKEASEIVVGRYLPPAINFFFLNLAIGGIAFLCGSLLNRRGPAIGLVVTIVFASVILDFLEQFIEPLKNVGFLSLLHYFSPVDVMRHGDWPIMHMLVLAGIAMFSWTIGAIVFARKDIPTA